MGTVFVDCTVFDEHGKVYWGTSAATLLQSDVPHSALRAHAAAVDLDRDSSAVGPTNRWLCLADSGAAQLLVQFGADYNAGGLQKDELSPEAQLRVNVVTWHP